MALSVSTVLFFILSCGLWVGEARKNNSVLTVQNGGKWGQWGPAEFCQKGHAFAFRVKEEPYRFEYDSTGLNGIALLCDDGKTITSLTGPWGKWKKEQNCRHARLVAFALRVQSEIQGDNTAASNIMFLCSDNTVLFGSGSQIGRFGPLSNSCINGSICGIQTRVQSAQLNGDDTALNDVRMYCCN